MLLQLQELVKILKSFFDLKVGKIAKFGIFCNYLKTLLQSINGASLVISKENTESKECLERVATQQETVWTPKEKAHSATCLAKKWQA